MITREPFILASITIVFMLGTTGCTLLGNDPEAENIPTATTTAAVTAPVETTAPPEPTETPSAEADAETIREGIYLDEWTKSVAAHLERQANVYLFDAGGIVAPSEMATFLDNLIVRETPTPFQVRATTTTRGNFTIKAWHPDGYRHSDGTTAYIVQSDPEITSTPRPTPSETVSELDAQAAGILFRAVGAVRTYMHDNAGQAPADEYMRTEGIIPDGWEWDFLQHRSDPTYHLIKVWHPEAFLYNSSENAATFSNYPQPELRPAYNVDITPYIMDAAIPPSPSEAPAPTPSPTETPTPTSSPSTADGVNA